MSDESTIEQLLAYLPPDRAGAILRDEDLPERCHGSVLFSDISGFTPLTEAIVGRYGARRGGEEFTDRLNTVYGTLIEPVLKYGGSIMGFAGDALTAFFDGDDGSRAVTAAVEMQKGMQQFENMILPGGEVVSLAMKVAISSGNLRRFVCGDPKVQLLDVLAGNVMDRMASCEGCAKRGEIAVDQATIAAIKNRVSTSEWRPLSSNDNHDTVAIVTAIDPPAGPKPTKLPALHLEDLERLRPWLIQEVYRRIVSGQNIFLTELRPAAALFARFSGIAFETDPDAPKKLDTYLKWVQRVISRLDGAMLQVTIGDKGSYFYAAFGAPVAHDDDTARAMTAALELSKPPHEIASVVPQVQIGLTRGTMRTGAYGGKLRRTYGVLGDDVNLAARLMNAAAQNEIIVSDQAARRQGDAFQLTPLDPIAVKGKVAPVRIHRLEGRRRDGILSGLTKDRYATPMIGRKAEKAVATESLKRAMDQGGQVITISAEAGMGKTRLLTEIVREAEDSGFAVFAGDCPVLAREASYTVWAPIMRSLLEVGSESSPEKLLALLTKKLEPIGPDLVPRAPLLGSVFNVSLPENDLTRPLDAKTRRASMEGLLIECLKHRCETGPVMLVLEECHWIDEASRNLLATIIQAIGTMPVAILMAHRPVEPGEIMAPDEASLDYITKIELGDMPPEDTRQLVTIALKGVFGQKAALPDALIEMVNSRANGNPFFIEEVANLLKSRNVNLHDPALLQNLELPASLHSLILGRIDQLTQDAQTTLKVSSVIGRLFRAAMVFGVHPIERKSDAILNHFEEMCSREVAAPEAVDDEDGYLFKHIVIQEVAYESLPYALRATIHAAIGNYIERIAGEDKRRWIDLLAFHFERSRNDEKKRTYLIAAGNAARESYAIQSAISYYRRALKLLEGPDRIDVLSGLGEVLEISGKWDDAFTTYREARDIAEESGTDAQKAQCACAIGDFHRKRGDFADAGTWLATARKEFADQGDELGAAYILHLEGTLSAQSGDFPRAKSLFQQALTSRERLGDEANAAKTLNNLGIVARSQGDVTTALQHYQRSLEIRRRLKDKREIANSLNNLGFAHRFLKEYGEARPLLEESVKLNRAVGDRWATANALTSLAELALDTNDAETAAKALQESIIINRDLGDKRAIAFLLEAHGNLCRIQNIPTDALVFFSASSKLRETIGAPLEPADAEKLNTMLTDLRTSIDPELCKAAEAEGRDLPLSEVIERAIA